MTTHRASHVKSLVTLGRAVVELGTKAREEYEEETENRIKIMNCYKEEQLLERQVRSRVFFCVFCNLRK